MKITEGLGELFERVVMPVTPFNSQLVGFGRAVSDQGLTASIYDVMVYKKLVHTCISISFIGL